MSTIETLVVASTLETLVKARELIADPKRWTQGVPARDKYGHIVLANHPSAVKWCASGALSRALGIDTRAHGVVPILDRAGLALFQSFSVTVNDKGPRPEAHAKVLAIFDHAIATLEGK